jgi:mono/diheme cytochrome c family protein
MLRPLIALSLACLLPATASAQCSTVFQRRTVVSTPYVSPTYNVVPVAVLQPFAVAIPVTSYLYSGAAYAPVAPAAVAPAAPATAPAAEFSDALIDRLIQRIEERLKIKSAPATLPPPVKTAATDVSSRAEAVLATNCAGCHRQGSTKGGPTIFLADGSINPSVDRRLVLKVADEGTMPPAARTDKSKAVSDDDVKALEAWAVGR